MIIGQTKEERVKSFMGEVKPIMDKYQFELSAKLVVTDSGLFPQLVVLDLTDPIKKDENTTPKQ